MKDIKWKYVNDSYEMSEAVVESIENKLKVTFPKDFIICVSKNGGGVPVQNILDISTKSELVFNNLVSFDIYDKYNYIVNIQSIEGLQKGLIAIADDGFGNFWCYDYRHTEDNPPIVYWNHDDCSIISAFESFSELLNSLYEYMEEE